MKLNTSKYAKDYIKELRKLLIENGLSNKLDELALNMLEVSYHRYIMATQVILSSGSTFSYLTTNNQQIYKERPEVKQAQQAHIELIKLLENFGLSPASRKRVKDVIVDEDNSPLTKFLNSTIKVK